MSGDNDRVSTQYGQLLNSTANLAKLSIIDANRKRKEKEESARKRKKQEDMEIERPIKRAMVSAQLWPASTNVDEKTIRVSDLDALNKKLYDDKAFKRNELRDTKIQKLLKLTTAPMRTRSQN